MENSTRRIDANPYNIESPNRLYVQWSDGNVPTSYFENDKYPTGLEPEWVWEDRYYSTPHILNKLERGASKYRRERVGLNGLWTIPIPIIQTVTDVKLIDV